MLVKANQGGYGHGQGNKRKDSRKEYRTCDHCKKIHGYPEWFKQLRKEKGSTSKVQVHLANNPLEEGHMIDKKGNGTILSPVISELVQQEVNKILTK